MLFQPIDHIVGDPEPLLLIQAPAQPAHEFARAPQRIGNGKPKHVAASPHRAE